MKDLLIKLFSAVGAGLVIGALWKIRGRIKDFWRKLWAGDSQKTEDPKITPPPGLEPKKEAQPEKVAQPKPPCLLLTCFEQQQPLFLQALVNSPDQDIAFDRLVCIRAEERMVYVTPPLLDKEASEITWTVLRIAAGADEGHDAVPILKPPDNKTVTMSPLDIASLRMATTCYFGIDLATIPLGEQVRTEIRTALQDLQEILGSRLCVLEIHKDVVESWDEAIRNKRWDIWTDIFTGLEDIRREAPNVNNRENNRFQ